MRAIKDRVLTAHHIDCRLVGLIVKERYFLLRLNNSKSCEIVKGIRIIISLVRPAVVLLYKSTRYIDLNLAEILFIFIISEL